MCSQKCARPCTSVGSCSCPADTETAAAAISVAGSDTRMTSSLLGSSTSRYSLPAVCARGGSATHGQRARSDVAAGHASRGPPQKPNASPRSQHAACAPPPAARAMAAPGVGVGLAAGGAGGGHGAARCWRCRRGLLRALLGLGARRRGAADGTARGAAASLSAAANTNGREGPCGERRWCARRARAQAALGARRARPAVGWGAEGDRMAIAHARARVDVRGLAHLWWHAVRKSTWQLGDDTLSCARIRKSHGHTRPF